VPGRKAVVFCVNIRHGEEVAELFRRAGIAARSVSGRMSRREREKHLSDFRSGTLSVLCACDILNEGWDCPDVEVLMMARPTLSKVIYLQQLGRGTRKAPGKDCLIVFDFVDNATRYNQSLNLHRLLGVSKYRPGGLLLAPKQELEQEEDAVASGEKPTTVLDIGVWARDFEEIDLFDWQEAVSGMIPVSELEVELATSEGLIRRAIDRGEVTPDHSLTLGDRVYHYFARDSVGTICEKLGIERIDAHNVKERFMIFVRKMDMAASYKPVLLLAILDAVNERGRARLTDVAANFRAFYSARASAGLVIERESSTMSRVEDLEDSEVQQVMIRMPFEKFERRKFLEYDHRDLAFLRFAPTLWRQLTAQDLDDLRQTCKMSISQYYERLEP